MEIRAEERKRQRDAAQAQDGVVIDPAAQQDDEDEDTDGEAE